MTDHGLTPIGGIGIQRGVPAYSTATRHAVRPAPDSPPPEVRQEIQAAARVIEKLAAHKLSLHFEVDQATQKLRVQVVDGDGRVIREIPTRSLFEVLSGGGLLIDQRG